MINCPHCGRSIVGVYFRSRRTPEQRRKWAARWRKKHARAILARETERRQKLDGELKKTAFKFRHDWTLADLKFLFETTPSMSIAAQARHLGRSWSGTHTMRKKVKGETVQKKVGEITPLTQRLT